MVRIVTVRAECHTKWHSLLPVSQGLVFCGSGCKAQVCRSRVVPTAACHDCQYNTLVGGSHRVKRTQKSAWPKAWSRQQSSLGVCCEVRGLGGGGVLNRSPGESGTSRKSAKAEGLAALPPAPGELSQAGAAGSRVVGVLGGKFWVVKSRFVLG